MKLPKARKLASGSWYVRVKVDGVVTNITRATKKEAEMEAAAIKSGARKQKLNAGLTLERACANYIKQREPVLSPATISGYRKIARTMFQDQMVQDVSQSKDYWQRAINQEAKRVSAKTLKNSWGFISTVIASATGERVQVRLPQVVANDLPFLAAEDLETFLAAIRGDSCEVQIILGLHSLRRSEILAMTWECIDLKNRRIMVHGAAVKGDEGLVYRAQNKNDTSRRTVPFMMPRLVELLEAVPEENRTGLLYEGDPGKIYKHLDAICRENNLPHISVHSLRRTFASSALHAGVSEAACQRIGGWADPTTMKKIYQKISDRDIQDQADKLNSFYGSVTKVL